MAVDLRQGLSDEGLDRLEWGGDGGQAKASVAVVSDAGEEDLAMATADIVGESMYFAINNLSC